MKKKLLLLFYFSLVICPFYGYEAISVLFLSSYDASYPTFTQHYEGINSVFSQCEEKIELSVEFLDSKRFPDEENTAHLYHTLQYKNQHSRPYDYIIASDDNALRFINDFQSELFPETPVVFFGVNDKDFAYAQNRNPYITGFIEDISYEETLVSIIKLLPEARALNIIYDATPSGIGDYRTILSANQKNHSIPVRYLSLSEMTFEELYSLVSRFDRNQPILLLSAFQDSEGSILNFYSSVRELVKYSGAPVFHLWSHGIGEGLIGGKVVDHQYYAELSANLVLEFIRGGSVVNSAVLEMSLNRFLFDASVLKRFSIKRKNLPKGALLIHRARIYSQETIRAILILILILAVLFCFLVIIINLYRMKKHAERKYRAIFFENKVPILITNPENDEILHYNKAADEFYGLKNKHFLGELQIENPGPILEGSVIQKHRNKSHEVRSVEVFTNTFQSDKNRFRINVIHDISEKESLRLQLQRTVKMDLVGKIASGIAHDFNNYLQGIIGYCSLLLTKEGDLEITQYLNKILDLGISASRLSKQLLSISKDEESEMDVINLNDVVKDVADFLSHSVKKEISIIQNIANDSSFILGNYRDLQNVFINMGLNAADAIESEGHIEFKLSKDKRTENILCSVIDNGIGIPQENMEKIFEPFFTTKEEGKGTGLGLASVFQIIEKHNGKINVSSIEKRGTEFTILFPADRPKIRTVPFSPSKVIR